VEKKRTIISKYKKSRRADIISKVVRLKEKRGMY